MTADKDRFCELCNMVFSSHVVAKSHYEGKVHTKNLRKQGLQPPGKCWESAPAGGIEHLVDPAASTTTPDTEVDLKDPIKHCALCAASFNNPQMALQHYNGRKHQRNQARQELIKELASSLMCQMCSMQFNSVEMYQAHMQGNKHQIREKKVIDLCKSQQKVYTTFADELADYIQVQKARGITIQVPPQADTQKTDEDEEEEEQKLLSSGAMIEIHKPTAKSKPHPQSRPGCYYPVGGWCSSYQGPSWPPHGWDNCPPPVPPGSATSQLPCRSIKRRRPRQQSSSSSCTDSSSYSSYSSSYSSNTSDSDDSEYRCRDKRGIRRSRQERCRRVRDEEQNRRKQHKRDSEERRREESGESDQERRKKRKHNGKQRRKEKKSREADLEENEGGRVMDSLKPENMMDSNKQTEAHSRTEICLEQGNGGQDEPAKHKYRKEKKKMKDRVDSRTEEEKLWDDSILGC
uniref:C2H2-type domain-containing protein n=1 Tax=Anabas testudineus TaxID=64144 RepID=A0A3Q1JSZ2_ANATE